MMMYYMHWTLEDVKSLTMDQMEWIIENLNKVKKLENRRVRKR
jgi:hypothetical protein